jgi:hypothetical protein
MHTAAVLPFPVHRARDAAAVRQAIRLRGEAEGHAHEATRAAAAAAIDALLIGRASAGWAIHVGCCALRGRPLPRLRAVSA